MRKVIVNHEAHEAHEENCQPSALHTQDSITYSLFFRHCDRDSSSLGGIHCRSSAHGGDLMDSCEVPTFE